MGQCPRVPEFGTSKAPAQEAVFNPLSVYCYLSCMGALHGAFGGLRSLHSLVFSTLSTIRWKAHIGTLKVHYREKPSFVKDRTRDLLLPGRVLC